MARSVPPANQADSARSSLSSYACRRTHTRQNRSLQRQLRTHVQIRARDGHGVIEPSLPQRQARVSLAATSELRLPVLVVIPTRCAGVNAAIKEQILGFAELTQETQFAGKPIIASAVRGNSLVFRSASRRVRP